MDRPAISPTLKEILGDVHFTSDDSEKADAHLTDQHVNWGPDGVCTGTVSRLRSPWLPSSTKT
jgi:hypothetical protein